MVRSDGVLTRTQMPATLQGQLQKYWGDGKYYEYALLKFGFLDKETTRTLLKGALLMDRCTTGLTCAEALKLLQVVSYSSVGDLHIVTTGTATVDEVSAPFVVYRGE